MPKASQIVRGVTANWIAMAVQFAVSFFLSPFVVHHLGNTAYGVWVMVVSLISYMGLLDLGLRGAVTRYVSRHYAQGDHKQSSQVVSAAFCLFLVVGVLIVSVSLSVAVLATKLFKIPSDMVSEARWVICITGVSFVITLACGVFGGVLTALHRFDLLSAVILAQTLFRAAGTLWVLKSGHGIVGLALWELAVALMANAAVVTISFWLYPQLRLVLQLPTKEILHSIWGYSFYAFLINAAVQIVYYTDNLVVGAFISASAVAFYAVGGNLIEYLRQFVSSLTTIFTPLTSTYEAQGDRSKLRQLLVRGTQATMLMALPIELALLFRGRTFIGLWMGAEYAATSGQILQILLCSQIFAIANKPSGGIAYGLSKHKPIALWATVEAAANLLLSIILVRHMGIFGVAWGTVIPALATQLGVWPRYICELVKMPVRTYLWQSWLRPVVALAPYGAACMLTEHFWHPATLVQFFLQIAAVLPLVVLGTAVFFWNDLKSLLQTRFRFLFWRSRDVPHVPLGGEETEWPV